MSEKLRAHKLLSALTIVIGFVLMIGKMYADSEPGGIPILLIVSGIGWFLTTRVVARGRLHSLLGWIRSRPPRDGL